MKRLLLAIVALGLAAACAGAPAPTPQIIYVTPRPATPAPPTEPPDTPTLATPLATPAGTPPPTIPPPTATPSPEYDALEDLAIGDCFQPIVDKDDPLVVLAVVIVACDVPHLMEVFALEQLTYPDDAEWPGQARIDRDAERLCGRAFEDYVGIPFERSVLSVTWFAPSELLFLGGDRLLMCTVEAHPSASFTESVHGTER